ncbi:hypothetical protein [Amycolatopsis sp. NPDC021455]|uniref:hypothetical protein n=1 Tax=Amycolatopsis sp. NPDC021455 TaxID=3154901 RepID=UPI0033FECC82
MPIKITGRLPADSGLEDIFDELVAKPPREQLIIASIRCVRTTTLARDGTTTAEVSITAVEALPEATDQWERGRELLDTRREFRTGKMELPL